MTKMNHPSICIEFVKKARALGFDCAASLSIKEADAAISKWKFHLQDNDFVKFLETDPQKIMPEAKSLFLLAYPYRTYESYPDGIGHVSGYYTASNYAYHACSEISGWLCSQGVRAVHTHKIPHKPLARAAGLGRYGRNGLIVRSGSHFVICLIIIDADVRLPAANVPVPDCESCGNCERACPTGCLKDGYVQASRCLRAYMTHNVEKIPDDLRSLMGKRILGCDECLNACPGLTRDDMPEQMRRLFAWDALADPVRFAENRLAIAELIGSNSADAVHKSAVRYLSGFFEQSGTDCSGNCKGLP